MEIFNSVAWILSLLVVWLWYRRQKPPSYPPGYSGIPVFGVIPFLSSNPAVSFVEWGKKLGSVFYVQMGLSDAIVLNDFDTIYECLIQQGKFSSDRADLIMFRSTRKANGLTLENYGKQFGDIKEIMVKTLKSFGIGKNSIESKIHEELEYLADEILTYDDKPFNPKNMIYLASSSIISNVTLGKRLGYKDPKLLKLLQGMRDIYNNQEDGNLIRLMTLFPILIHFPVFSGAYKRLYNIVAMRTELFTSFVEEHEKTFNENNIRDLIDHFILKNKMEPNNPAYSKDNLVQALTDLFDAGSDTVPIALLFCFLYLAKNPEFQSQLTEEISNNIGSSLPSMAHIDDLPHVASFIDEISRHRTVAPLALFHKTSQNIKLLGFEFPKNTEIIPNLWAVHRDPKCFNQPNDFIPDRFIKDGKYEKSKYLVQFGMGPRKCLGYQLAEKELFIWLCGILQRFEIRENKSCPLPDFEDGCAAIPIYSPKQYKVEFRQR